MTQSFSTGLAPQDELERVKMRTLHHVSNINATDQVTTAIDGPWPVVADDAPDLMDDWLLAGWCFFGTFTAFIAAMMVVAGYL